MQQVLHMKGGEDKDSYAQNSLGQKFYIVKSKDLLEKCIEEFCISSTPVECMKIADLGCSSGPNTTLAMQMIIESIDKNCYKLNQKPPPIQFFLNDLISNDFNTVFKSLPAFHDKLEKNGRQSGSCFVAAMPGSFYERLFPEKSMHFMHSANSLHWLSQVPKGLKGETGLPLNKEHIYMAKTSPSVVRDAYLDQFQNDFSNFLNMRSVEMVTHGHLFFHLHCRNEDDNLYSYRDILAITLNEMVTEGLVEEIALDTFNLPMYEPSIEEARQIIEKEGSFKIMHLEVIELQWRSDGNIDDNVKGLLLNAKALVEFVARSSEAAFGSIFADHFGDAIVNDLFGRFVIKLSEYLGRMSGSTNMLVISLSKK